MHGYLRTYAETQGFLLGRPVQARPTPDGKAVVFLRSEARVPKLRLFEFDVATAQTRELLAPEHLLKGAEEKLSAEEKARRERMRVAVGGFTDYQLSEDGALVLVTLSGKPYVFERSTGAVRALASGPGTVVDPRFSPDGRSVAYVRDHDLYVHDLATGAEVQLTTGGSATRTHGLAEFVAQEEMGRFSGYWWAPDSKSIAFAQADASAVEVWYVADPARPGQKPLQVRYPRAGKANVKVRLGVIPAAGGETVWVRWDVERYPYLAQARWDKDSPLVLVVQSRLQNEEAILRVDTATGDSVLLANQASTTWLNLHPDTPRWLRARPPWLFWVREDREDSPALGFLWAPENREVGHGVLDLAFSLPERDRRNFVFHGLVATNVNPPQVVYQGSGDPTAAHVYALPLDGTSEIDQLTDEPGVYSATFAKDHSVYVLTSTTLKSMPQSTVYRADGSPVGELPSVAENPPFAPQVELLKVGEGMGFYCGVVRPREFDAKKQYPVIVNAYGGPRHQMVLAAMRPWLLNQWIADQGFIVVAIDGRGTPNRGSAWERAIYKKLGTVPLEDQVAGLEALGRRFPEMDRERVGIYGWSFGGYLSALAVMRRPDVFKAAVAGAPVTDWLDYDTHYTERYLGLPDKDADAYHEASLLTYLADLKRPLLLVHGTADDNVYFRHTLRLADALFRAGKDFELLPLTGLTHMVPDPVVQERLYTRIVQHFQRYLV